MKKLISLIVSVILVCSVAVLLCSCGETGVTVESILKTDENFAGTRTVNISLPTVIGAKNAVSYLNNSLPDMGKYNGCLSLTDISDSNNENEISFVISFDSKDDYVSKINALLGTETTVNLAKPDNILTKGTRYREDFDVSQLINWMTSVFQENFDVKSINYNYESNIIDLNGSLFTTGTTANVNEVEGNAINKITISTSNSKKNVYDREFTFEIPEDVFKELGDNLKYYFDSCTNELAQYSGWTSKGNYEEYSVIFKELSADELQNVTNQMLDVSDGLIQYGDFTNSSTPLSEGLIFRENINTMNFMGKDKSMVPVEYNYSVPTNTTYGEGSVLENGSWINKGSWQDSTYSLEFKQGTQSINIPDGIQYKISGINFYLNNNGGDSFKRTVDILYAKDNADGLNYSYNFFKSKNAEVSKEETDNNYICRVETEGTALEISKKTVECFGGGNYMDYDYRENPFDLSDNTTLIDYINIGYMLTSENAEKPMTYTVTKSGNENINRVSIDSNSEKTKLDKADENGCFTVEFKGGNASVTYNGTIADWGKITLFIVISCVIILISAALIIYYIRKSLRAKNVPSVSNAPQQTTTFFLKDLGKKKNTKEDE
ncbi:MAG: hypothetical protein PUD24_06510 [Oscillospiraceae bacterium]|nr:hypothetical protein [Oscillospiraceae bacterium]